MSSWIHVANVLYLASYLVRDILWLRFLTVIAGLTLVPYYYMQATPLWAPIAWNGLFTAINVVQIQRLLLERRPVRLSAEEERLHKTLFAGLSARRFLRLLGVGSREEAKAGTCLVEQAVKHDRLLLVSEGSVDVQVDGRPVARLEAGRFVGEMSYLTGEETSASVWAADATRYIAWGRKELESFLHAHPDVRAALQLVIGTDLARKLKAPKS